MSENAESKNRHLEVAKAVVLRGESFRSAMVSAGYSQTYADIGPKSVRKDCPGMNKAFQRAEQMINWAPDVLKRAAVNRIATTCLDDRNSDNLKAAELIGKFKTVDLFVRNGEAQVGIFFGAVEARDDEFNALDVPAVPAEPSSE